MRRRWALLLAVLMLLTAQTSALASPRVNAACKKPNQRSGLLVCSKVQGRLVWRKAALPKPTPPAPPVDYAPASTGATVGNQGIIGRTLMGYQAWFACPNDGTGPDWSHWFDYGKPATAPGLTVDFWPDVSEYSTGELCRTELVAENGQPLAAYSGGNQTVINRHFSWLQQYNIDGVAFQRFVSRMIPNNTYAYDWTLLERVSKAAQRYGRVFYFEYDTNFGTDDPTRMLSTIKQDWKRAVDAGVTKTSAYLQLNGLPLVELWGIGLPGVSRMSAAQAADLIAFFKQNPDPKYRAAVIGGLGSYWREGINDAEPGAEWAKVYRSFDVINPWSVGRYGSTYVSEAQNYAREVVAGDVAETQKLGIVYLPVVWPGSSWTNLQRNRGERYERNMFPRYCGSFYWQQVVNVLDAGAKQMFIAMFDEVDEGTAMYKMVTAQTGLPKDSQLIPLDIDGCKLNSDFYLRLASATADATRSGGVPGRGLPIPLAAGETMSPPTFGTGTDGVPVHTFTRGLG